MKIIVTGILLTCLNVPVFSQNSKNINDQAKYPGSTSTLRGKIQFNDTGVVAVVRPETGFPASYKLTNRSQLFFTAFLAKPLAAYLQALAPSMAEKDLNAIGSFQFSFYVDDSVIYVCNMPPDNIEPENKTAQVLVSKSLIARPRQRSWGESIWNLFMRSGGQQVLTDGKHKFRLEIRPFTTLPGSTAGPVIAAGELIMDVNLNPVIDVSKIRLNKPAQYPGIQVSKEAIDTNKIKTVKGKIGEYVYKDITSIIVLKDGKLLVEEYFNGSDRASMHDVRSVGKTFASTAAGIAIGDGFIKDEKQRLDQFYDLTKFKNFSTYKANTTIYDLLTMSAPFEGNDDDRRSAGNEENMYPTADWVKFTLDLPSDSARPKDQWHYFTAGVVVLGDIIDKKVPGGLEVYMENKLFKPLNITNYKWQYTPQKVANTAGGIRMNALDFAKYGQLYKNGGKWNGRQLIPKNWIEKTFSKQKEIPGRTGEFYGYLFWNKEYVVNGKKYETFYCAGNGGNKIYIFKDQPLVIVVTATAYGTPYGHSQVDQMMTEYILPAVIK